ncbi:Hsp70 family protein [Luteolibacter pohnpeiensis]|uniref:Hsp70 family protein n=1 Tax=Luteolibacter pohnpeiensis TaxID=454153 RepID=A0A934S7R7_9BACT|nr:Hsp70 family protein [Luteolibacter pohnpeiensis]MBK1882361.1 Hsp70 family protein [Luteolibacter pohnpeiensis]
MSDIILGIDLGTTNSAVGVVDSGFPILLANEEGKRITPSAVWLSKDGATAVGEKALRQRAAEPGRVVTSVKRLIGRRRDDLADDFSLPLDWSQAGLPLVLGKSPEEISAEILREMKRIAEWRLEREVTKAVITVPAYFNDGQRAATMRAGEMAGLEVVRIINEPTAAALAYGLDKLEERARVAVYDLGGGTFDLSILEMQDGVFQVLATHGDTRLGGDDLDRLILQHVLQAAGLEEAQLEPAAKVRFLAEAERVKKALSSTEQTEFQVPFYDGEKSIGLPVTRERMEELARPWIAKTLRHCRQAMVDAGLNANDLSAVVLVGGSTRIPAVRTAVAEFFGREPDVSQHPDEAIALGATIQAGVLSGALRKMVLLDVTPLSLGIETFGGLMNVLIPRNTTIPCKAGEMFTNAADGQAAMRVRVLQGEREMAADNWELGAFEVNFESAPKGQARVGVQFKIDENGILEVLARDVATGTDTVVRIESAAVDVDDAAVETMIGQSVDYAFEDMAQRIFTEARLKAEELLPAVEMVLEQGLAEADERETILTAMSEVKQAMQAGAANPLKAAVQRLDSATEALAARLVEKAMDEALQRQLGE